jgi:hypothetical protein
MSNMNELGIKRDAVVSCAERKKRQAAKQRVKELRLKVG